MNADIATTRDDIHLGPRLLLLIEPQTRRNLIGISIALLYGSREPSKHGRATSFKHLRYFDARMSILCYCLRKKWV